MSSAGSSSARAVGGGVARRVRTASVTSTTTGTSLTDTKPTRARATRRRRRSRRGRRRRRGRSRRGGGRSPRRRRRRRAASAGKNASTAISSCASVDSSGPANSSAAGIVRRPRTDATSTDPSSSRSTIGISAAASACTMEPTVVPRLRIVGWATWLSAIASSGWACGGLGRGEHLGVPGEGPDPHPGLVHVGRGRGPAGR